jgi:hypothetical protein
MPLMLQVVCKSKRSTDLLSCVRVVTAAKLHGNVGLKRQGHHLRRNVLPSQSNGVYGVERLGVNVQLRFGGAIRESW